MIKIICLFTRKPGLTMAEFQDYYENTHVPLVEGLLPRPAEYRRNYAIEEREYQSAHIHGERGVERPFDVMTEVSFDDEAHYQQMLGALADPAIGRAVADDEANFLDRPAMRTYFVRECG